MEFLNAIFLGIVEGLTEFIPVSSTGHLILFVDLLGFKGPPGHVFEVVIQFGAILAILVLYWKKFWNVLVTLRAQPASQRFVGNILLAFAPAMVIGFFVHDFIKTALFNPTVVAVALIAGGIAILAIEKYKPMPTVTSTEEMPAKMALKIGLIQCLSMIPGMSRSGATIMGALLLGLCAGVICFIASTCCTIVCVARSRISASFGLMLARNLRRMRSAESWIGVSGFLISCATRRATSAQAALRCASIKGDKSSNVAT